jgi:hypothetical protein
MFNLVINDVGVESHSLKGRQRRLSDLSWKTAVTELRGKRQKGHMNDEEDEDNESE